MVSKFELFKNINIKYINIMKESYINEQLLNENLIIDPKDLKDDIEIIVRDKLKGQVEGICFKDGYVIPGSVKVIKRKIH